MRLTELPPNCLPSRVLADSVYLIDTGSDRLAEPLYQITLARLCEQGDPVRLRLPLHVLPVITEGVAAPRGLIVHTGRCGSTLLANMLGAHPGVRMIKEPEALNQILLDGRPIEDVATLLRAFGRGLPATGAVVVKCTNWNVLELGRLLSVFPDTAAIFLWRPAAEVVASCMDVPPPWQSWQHAPERRDDWLPHDPADPPDFSDLAVFYAHAWRVSVIAALTARRAFPDRVKIISYAELRDGPGQVIRAGARHFGLPVTPELTTRMTRHTARYSKNPAVRFDPSGRHARLRLTCVQQRAVGRICGRLETELDLARRS